MTTDRDVVALNQLIADATVFYQKVRHYHWNVSGPHFFDLHRKFEALYTEWADVIDALAERVRALDALPLHTLAAVLETSELDEDPAVPDAPEMMRRVVHDLKVMHGTIDQEIDQAEEDYDRVTADLLSKIQDQIEEDLWMLKAWLGEV